MKRLPAADVPVVNASAKAARLAQAEESSASIPLLGGKSLEEGSDKGQTKAPSTTSDRSGLHDRVLDFR